MLTTRQVLCAPLCARTSCVRMCVCVWERESYLVDGRVWLPCARGRMELGGTDWLCTLIGCGQNVNDCSCLSRCQVFGDSFWGGMGCVRLCVWRREHWSLWEKAGKKKGKGGQEDREREREQELVKRGREGASGSEAGLPLKHCSLSFASLRKLSFSSRCLSLLLAASTFAAWPWPWWTPWSPCPPREEERKRCSGGGRREEGTTAHFASLMRVWKLINHHQHRGGEQRGAQE